MDSLTLAGLEDLEARMGPISDTLRASAALLDASMLIHQESGWMWVEDGVDGTELPETIPAATRELIRMIACKVAQRVLANPEGVSQDSLGSFSQTKVDASTDAYLTRSERRMVHRAAGTGLGTIEYESPYQPTTDVYMAVAGSDEPFPMGPWPTHL